MLVVYGYVDKTKRITVVKNEQEAQVDGQDTGSFRLLLIFIFPSASLDYFVYRYLLSGLYLWIRHNSLLCHDRNIVTSSDSKVRAFGWKKYIFDTYPIVPFTRVKQLSKQHLIFAPYTTRTQLTGQLCELEDTPRPDQPLEVNDDRLKALRKATDKQLTDWVWK